jgi:hypothetical protein
LQEINDGIMAKRSYPIPNQEILALSYEAHLEDLKEFILLVESLGCVRLKKMDTNV